MAFIRTKVRRSRSQPYFVMVALCMNWNSQGERLHGPWAHHCCSVGQWSWGYWFLGVFFPLNIEGSMVCSLRVGFISCLIFVFPESSLVLDTKVDSKFWICECFWINFEKLNMSFLSYLICVAPDGNKVQDKKTAASHRPSTTISGQNSNHSGNKPGIMHCLCCGKRRVIPKVLCLLEFRRAWFQSCHQNTHLDGFL